MDVLSLCRLPIGVVHWHSPVPSLTVIVKATFTLERDGYAALATEQQPLSLDRPGVQSGPNELFLATDFVPFKPRADVLLAGHAHAPAPAWAIRARLRVNAFDKQFFACAGKPAAAIPLADAYLRSGPSPDAGFVRVAARASWSPERAVFAGARLISPLGAPLAPLPRGFDYRIFNAAPPDQQLDTPLSTAFVTLEGLLPEAAVRRAQLPGLYPRVFLLSHMRDPRRAAPPEAPLRADTLWIDTDRAQCTLTFRGVVELLQEPSELVMVLAQPGAVQSWSSICDQLARAIRTRTVDASELAGIAPASGWPSTSAPPKPTVEWDWAERRISQMPDATLAPVASKPALPVVPHPASVRTDPRSHRGPRGTDVPPAPAGEPLPPAPTEEEPEWATGTVGLKPGQLLFAPVVPFEQAGLTDPGMVEARLPRGPHGTELPPAPDAEDVEDATAWAESTVGLKPGQLFAPAVPFRPASPLPPPGVAPEAEPDWATGTTSLKPGQVFATAMPFGAAAGSMQEEPPVQEAPHAARSLRGPTETETLDPALVPTGIGAAHTEKAVLPFQRGAASAEPAKAELPRSESLPKPRRNLARTEPPPAAMPPSQSMPWVSRSPVPPEPHPAWSSRPATPFRTEASHSPPPAPPQSAEPPLLPAEQYAAIKAAIWTAPAARDGMLEQHGLTEIDWEIAEQRQMEALEREAAEGRAEKMLALMMALERVRGGQGRAGKEQRQ